MLMFFKCNKPQQRTDWPQNPLGFVIHPILGREEPRDQLLKKGGGGQGDGEVCGYSRECKTVKENEGEEGRGGVCPMTAPN